ncbi:MAG: caspase family protein [Chloroflexi bacterium]|nr:caspase family protein [Chloroflexota bacterium]
MTSSTFDHGYALLIGVGNCKVKEYSLSVAANDMRALQQLLVMPDFCAYPQGQVQVLCDENATRKGILDKLAWLKQCAEQDADATCIVFYSGHGKYDSTSGAFWLVPHDYYPNQPETRLKADDFQVAISAIAAKRLLVFIDSCHAAGIAAPKDGAFVDAPPDNSPPPGAFLTSLAQGEGRVVFASSGEREKSYYPRDGTLSIYTKHLLLALQGAGNISGDPEVRVGHLMSYLGTAVEKDAIKEWRESQKPRFKFDTQDFPIAVLRGGRGLPPGGWTDVVSEAQNAIRTIAFYLPPTIAANFQGPIYNYGTMQLFFGNAGAYRTGPLLPTIPDRRREVLIETAGKIKLDYASWRALYHNCRPGDPNLLTELTLSKIIHDLCSLPFCRSIPPIFEFAERLAVEVKKMGDQATYDELRGWVEETAELLELPVTHLEIANVSEVDSACVQIDVTPDTSNHNHPPSQWLYLVEVTEWPGRKNEPKKLHTDEPELREGPWRLDQVPALLDHVFDRSAIPASAILEFIVPRELLVADLDRWKYQGKNQITYGIQYPVVVRLRDRLAMPDNADRQMVFSWWRKKWDEFHDHIRHCDCNALHWLTPKEADELDDVWIDWQDAEELTCLGVAALPADKDALFTAVCDAGIPIAVLSRRPSEPLLITALMGGSSLAELYEVVHQARRANRKDESHISNHLTLLWDDPKRIPLKYRREGVFR